MRVYKCYDLAFDFRTINFEKNMSVYSLNEK